MVYLSIFLNMAYTLDFWTKTAKVVQVCSGVLCGAVKLLFATKLVGIVYFIGSIWGAEMQALYNVLTVRFI